VEERERIGKLHDMLFAAESLAEEDDRVLDEAMPRIVAIVHDALRLIDLEYFGDTLDGARHDR
jgi:hypothetical protein